MVLVAIALDGKTRIVASFHHEIDAIGAHGHLRRHLITLPVEPIEQFALDRRLAEFAQVRHTRRRLAERSREVSDQAAPQPVGLGKLMQLDRAHQDHPVPRPRGRDIKPLRKRIPGKRRSDLVRRADHRQVHDVALAALEQPRVAAG